MRPGSSCVLAYSVVYGSPCTMGATCQATVLVLLPALCALSRHDSGPQESVLQRSFQLASHSNNMY